MGSKRGNENPQASKEDYYKLTEGNSTSVETSRSSFERANPNVLAQRRIVRTGHPTTATSGNSNTGVLLPSSSASQNVTNSSSTNVFSGVMLAPSSTESKSPFASVQLKAPAAGLAFSNLATHTSNDTSANVPMFSFGSAPMNSTGLNSDPTKLPKSDNTTQAEKKPFVFGSTCTPAEFKKSEGSVVVSKYSKYAILLDDSFDTATRNDNVVDFLATTRHYKYLMRGSFTRWKREESEKHKIQKAVENQPNPSTETHSLPPREVRPISFGGFSSSPSIVAKSSFGNSDENVGSSLMFGKKPMPEKTEVNAFSMSNASTSFGASNTTPDDNNDDDHAPIEPKVPVEKIQEADWEILSTSDRVRFYRLTDPKKPAEASWTSFAFGKLNVQRSTNQSAKYRMIMRDDAMGKVLINIGFTKNTKFVLLQEGSTPSKNKQQTRKIQFSGTNDADRGYEGFIIKALPETALALHQTLQQLL